MAYLPLHAMVSLFFSSVAVVAFAGRPLNTAARSSSFWGRLAARISELFNLNDAQARARLLAISPLCLLLAAVSAIAVTHDLHEPFVWKTISAPMPRLTIAEITLYAIGGGVALYFLLSAVPLLRQRFRPWYIVSMVLAVSSGLLAAHLHLDPRAFVPFYAAIAFLVIALIIGRTGRACD